MTEKTPSDKILADMREARAALDKAFKGKPAKVPREVSLTEKWQEQIARDILSNRRTKP